jgi:hypothetical protein
METTTIIVIISFILLVLIHFTMCHYEHYNGSLTPSTPISARASYGFDYPTDYTYRYGYGDGYNDRYNS